MFRPFYSVIFFFCPIFIHLSVCSSPYTVEPLNKGHIGEQFVHCRKVVHSLECPLSEVPLYLILSLGVEDYSVRLLPGDREGVVEVSVNGRWGTVCDQSWISSSGAQAVCDQLGIESEIAASTTPSTRYIHTMTSVQCSIL